MLNANTLVQRMLDNQAKARGQNPDTFRGIGVGRGARGGRRTPKKRRQRAQWTGDFVQAVRPGVAGGGAPAQPRGGARGRGIGQAGSALIPQAGGDVLVLQGDDGAWYPKGHPKCPIDNAGPPTTMDCESESPCGVNVIGGNTFGTAGIAPGITGTLVVTAGDAGSFHPMAIYFEALPFSTNDLVDITALPAGNTSVPVFLVDALIGRVSMLRRGGAANVALTQGAYANTKELVAVDWGTYTSVQEQNLSLLFYNPNAALTIHVGFVEWGDI